MSNLTTYAFNANQIRVVEIDGQPWFLAKDVCLALGIHVMPGRTQVNTTMALAKLDESERCFQRIETSAGPRKMAVISESGLYKLIMRSDKPEARAFQDWVTKVVLPAIRKDGAYVMGEEKVATGEMTEDELVAKAMAFLQRKVAQEKQSRQQMVRNLPCSSEEAWT